jgi:hypothetical protein
MPAPYLCPVCRRTFPGLDELTRHFIARRFSDIEAHNVWLDRHCGRPMFLPFGPLKSKLAAAIH